MINPDCLVSRAGMQDGYLTANVTYIDDDEDFNADSAEVKDVMSSIVALLQAILEGIPVITRYQLVHQLGTPSLASSVRLSHS